MKLAGKSILWGLTFVLSFVYLQICHAFHFLFIEQEHLFLYDLSYIRSTLFKIGGLSDFLADYLVQFYCIPYVGASVTSVLSVMTGIFLCLSFRKTACRICILPALIPVVVLVFSSYHEALQPEIFVSLLFMSAALCGFSSIRKGFRRVVYAACATVTLFFAAGPVAALFAVCVIIQALFESPETCLPYLIPSVLIVLLVAIGFRCQFFGELRHILLPDGYYSFLLHPESWLYATWWCFPLSMVLAMSSRFFEDCGMCRSIAAGVCSAALVSIGLYMHGCSTRQSDFYKELDYYMYKGQADRIIGACSGHKLDNYIYRNILNRALAEKGVLGDEAFNYPQSGPQSLLLEWQRIPYTMSLLSNVYFTMGHAALSRRMAFESSVSYNNSNPRMLQRLAVINLAYGQVEVAEKYLARLRKTKFYRDWALNAADDASVAELRACLPATNNLSGLEGGLETDLQLIAEANPSHKTSIQYAGMLYLLEKDMDSFASLIDKYYGSEVLPTLPRHFQEAVLVYTERDRALRLRYNIQDDISVRYEEFKNYFSANRKKPDIRSEMGRRYGDSFWYYYLY